MSKTFRLNLVNFILFQISWFACVLGAAHNLLWPSVVVIFVFVAWQLSPQNRCPGDIRLVALCVAIGIVLDSVWIRLGIIKYEMAYPSQLWAPIWIIFLWVSLALTINHSLAWVKRRLIVAALFGAIGSPLSYYAGSRLGAAELPADVVITVAVFAVSWAFVMTGLAILADRWMISS